MSRLASLSAEALRTVFSPDADKDLIILLTITSRDSTGTVTTTRLANNYLTRISETADDIMYGVVSRTNDYYFIPFNFTLPSEEENSTPRCAIQIFDATRFLIPLIRNIVGAPTIKIEVVLSSTPDTVEIDFGNFLLGGITYNANTISGELMVESLAQEPFPAHSFTPSYFAGMF
jgi:hypothetical protein